MRIDESIVVRSDRPLRICDVNNFYTPVGGGVRVYHERKLAYCRDRDIPYCLVIPSDRDERLEQGSTVRHHVPAVRLGSSGYRLIVSSRALARVFSSFGPDVIEIGSPYVLPLVVPRALHSDTAATIGFYHADYPDAYVRKITGWISRRMAPSASRLASKHVRWTYERMDAVFGASNYVLEKLHTAGIRRLFKTPLGVDSEVFRPDRFSESLRASLGAPTPKKLLLFLARLTTEKGIDLLMEAYPHFRDVERVQLVVGGHGPYERHVDRFVTEFPEVRRLPFVSDRIEVAALMASADLFLSMSRDETFGLAIAEALACGTPVIVPDAGAAPELLPASGVPAAYRAGDVESFVARVRAGLEIDSRAQSDRLRAHAVRYDWDVTFDRIMAFYRKVVEARRSGGIAGLEPPDPHRWNETPP